MVKEKEKRDSFAKITSKTGKCIASSRETMGRWLFIERERERIYIYIYIA